MIKSSDPKGHAFIQTKQLDGETNLKLKTVPKDAIKTINSLTDEQLHQSHYKYSYDGPNPYVYKYNGTLE